jgi:Fe-S cluster biogenesis protein NfuA
MEKTKIEMFKPINQDITEKDSGDSCGCGSHDHDHDHKHEDGGSCGCSTNKKDPKELELIVKLKDFIEKFRPFIQRDGGDMGYGIFEKGILYIELKGACVGCGSTSITLKENIETVVTAEFSEVLEVKDYNEFKKEENGIIEELAKEKEMYANETPEERRKRLMKMTAGELIAYNRKRGLGNYNKNKNTTY